MTYNLGSVVAEVSKTIDDIPAGLSGTSMNNLIDRRLFHMNSFLGTNVSGNNIADKYKPHIVNATAAELLGAMETFGIDTSSIKLGDLSVGQGTVSSTTKARQYFEDRAMKDLKILKGRNYYKAFG